MDKERKAYEALLHAINTRSRSSSTAEQLHYQLQLQFLREFESQTTSEPYGSKATTQLARLLTEELTLKSNRNADDSLNLNAWLLWLNELVLSHNQQLGDKQPLLKWLLQRVEEEPTATDALRCLLSVLETLPLDEARTHFPRLAVIQIPDKVEAALLLILCQDVSFGAPGKLEENELQLSIQLANSLMKPHYEGHWTSSTKAEQERLQLLLAHTLQLLQKIAAQHADYVQQYAPELLGFALANIRYRSETQLGLSAPHRLQPAQQSAGYYQDADNLCNSNNQNVAASGRRAKSRKMRSLTKQRNNGNVQEASNDSELAAGQRSDRVQQLLLQGSNETGMRTNSGDSESACTPTSDGAASQLTTQKQQRQCLVKVRLAALQLLGAVTKLLPRRTLYGYWHALFPSNDGGNAKDHLLYIGANDGNVRCRALALQLAAQLIYGSKPYLAQANCASARSNYTPFAQSLASSVLTAYGQLTSILEREYAPPVLTNCLKCLAVLVQATPFEQLEMGFVYDFVPHVKKLARHVDTTVKVSALLVMEMLMTTPRFTQEIACAVGLPKSERRLAKTNTESNRRQVCQDSREQQEFQQLCDSEEEDEAEEVEVEEQTEADGKNLNQPFWPHIPRNSWLLRLVLRYLECPATVAPLRVECLQVLLAMSTHFGLLRDHLGRLACVLSNALHDASRDVRLYGARCLDAVGYQMARHVLEFPESKSELNPFAEGRDAELLPESNAESQQRHLSFWQHMLPVIYAAYQDAGTAATLSTALCDALSNMGSYSFELLPQAQRNGLLAFLLGCSSDDSADRMVRAAALRALAVYVMHPTLRADLVFVEHAAELALRLSGDSQLVVRIKASWALGNISDALIASSQTQPERSREEEHQSQQQERISQALLSRLIEATVQSCSDHDKVRSNAVRALGNLLRLLPSEEHALMQRAVTKLLDCVRAAGSAKVKWNACYAIGNLVRSRVLFTSSASSSGTLFAVVTQLIVQHSNFKVRINATAVLLQVKQRADFSTHFTNVWRSLLVAIERSHALDTFEEYNHRDALQQQLCLAMAHMLALARPDDLLTCRDTLEGQLEVVSDTWRRVAYRILPEQAAPLFTCVSLLDHRFVGKTLTSEQRNALTFLTKTLRLDD